MLLNQHGISSLATAGYHKQWQISDSGKGGVLVL